MNGSLVGKMPEVIGQHTLEDEYPLRGEAVGCRCSFLWSANQFPNKDMETYYEL